MSLPKDNSLLENARQLRRDMTPQERRLWYCFLRTYPVKFYKQRIIGPFIVDFYCASAKLVIEIDGSQHYSLQGEAYDAERTAYLESFGLLVVRYPNNHVSNQFQAVCESIHNIVQQRLAMSGEF